MTPIQKLEAILLGYATDPNTCGYDPNNLRCMYLTPDGNKCAIGKILDVTHPSYSIIVKDYVSSVIELGKKYGREILLPEFRGVAEFMLFKAQRIHDNIARLDWETALYDLDELESMFKVLMPELRKEIEKYLN